MILKLKAPTEHAVEILKFIRDHSEASLSAKEISKNVGLTNSYLMKIVQDLKKAGIVSSTQGRYGGFCLTKPADEISLYDVINVMEGDHNAMEGNHIKVLEADILERHGEEKKLEQIMGDLGEIIERYLRHIKLSYI